MTRLRFTVPVIALLAAASAGLGSVPAVQAAPDINMDAVVSASGIANSPAVQKLKLSQEAFDTVRGIAAARIAIFNGDIKTAKSALESAQKNLQAMNGNADKYAAETTELIDASQKVTTHWIAADGTVDVVENYTLTTEKAKHLAAANEHLKAGKHKEAMEELKLANVDIVYKRLLIPFETTTQHVNDALDMIEHGRVYEASLALKGAQEGYQIDTSRVLDISGT